MNEQLQKRICFLLDFIFMGVWVFCGMVVVNVIILEFIIPSDDISPDSKTVYADPSKNREFTRENFILDVGKEKFGLGQLSKQDISIEEDENGDEIIEETTTTSPKPAKTKSKTSSKITVPGL